MMGLIVTHGNLVAAVLLAVTLVCMYCAYRTGYETEAMRRGATICLDKTKICLVEGKLIEYAYRQSCGYPQITFHKLMYVHADTVDSSNGLQSGVLSAAMLQKGFYIVHVGTLADANDHLLVDDDIELILCDTALPDGSELDLLHHQRYLAEQHGDFIKSRPLFILTDSKDLATEYQYRQEGVNDYLTSPISITELIQRIRCFIAPREQIQMVE